jgi:hypothetical protein
MQKRHRFPYYLSQSEFMSLKVKIEEESELILHTRLLQSHEFQQSLMYEFQQSLTSVSLTDCQGYIGGIHFNFFSLGKQGFYNGNFSPQEQVLT